MIYVHGDAFAAASYAVSPYTSAIEDPVHYLKGNVPHPKNLEVSFAKFLSNVFHQPLNLAAVNSICHAKIFRETIEAIENTHRIRYVVITWPDFFRGEVWENGKNIQFSFENRVNFLNTPAIDTYIQNFSLHTAHSEFNRMLEELCILMDEREIQYTMLMSNSQVDAKFGKWTLNPISNNITKWAEPQGLLNSANCLTSKGHIELAKLLIQYLT